MVPEQLRGEIDALAAARHYFSADGPGALSYATRALEKIPADHASALGFALIVQAFAKQMTGDHRGALDVLSQALGQAENRGATFKGRMLAGFCFTYWLGGDLNQLQQAAVQYRRIGRMYDLPESRAFAEYFLGITAYHLNDLPTAERHLTSGVEESRLININNFAHCAFALALTHLARGRAGEALRLSESVVSLALDAGNASLLETAKAFQEELALRTGRIMEAMLCTEQKEVQPLAPAHRCYSPHITAAKILIAQEDPVCRRRAHALLARLREFFTTTHNTPFLIEVLALEALLCDAEGDEKAGLAALEQAITLARPGGFIRVFVDLGPKMAGLLNRLREQEVAADSIGRILAAFHPPVSSSPRRVTPQPLVEPLTNRELEILALLAERLRNKEIAEKLFISPETVKRHTINIYQKLNVNNRREAADKGNALGLV
jgi:LuxR family maltose regulon positive regulatory protein